MKQARERQVGRETQCGRGSWQRGESRRHFFSFLPFRSPPLAFSRDSFCLVCLPLTSPASPFPFVSLVVSLLCFPSCVPCCIARSVSQIVSEEVLCKGSDLAKRARGDALRALVTSRAEISRRDLETVFQPSRSTCHHSLAARQSENPRHSWRTSAAF